MSGAPPLLPPGDNPSSTTSRPDNSFFTFPTPRKSNQKRPVTRDGGQKRRRAPTPKGREVQVLHKQVLLLLGTATMSFILFLLFTLPPIALVGLTVMVTSLGACLVVAYALVKTRYHLELDTHPLGLIRYLPESIQELLTEKSLNDCLSPSGDSRESLNSLSQSNYFSSKDSLSSYNTSSSKGSAGSLSSAGQTYRNFELGENRQIHQRGVRRG